MKYEHDMYSSMYSIMKINMGMSIYIKKTKIKKSILTNKVCINDRLKAVCMRIWKWFSFSQKNYYTHS